MANKTVQHDGGEWQVIGTGVTREDGKTYCHLASTTQFRQQRNGRNPVQMADWVDLRDPVAAFYGDRAASGQAALTAHR